MLKGNEMNHQGKYKLSRIAALVLGSLSLANVANAADTSQAQPAAQAQQPAQGQDSKLRRSRETSFPQIASGPWNGPKLADGQPDIGGVWSNTISNHGNFEDPQGRGGIGAGQTLGKREERAPSRVSDPVDGHVPFQPWAAEKVKEFRVGFQNPTYPGHVEPNARCAPGGVPKSLYWHGYDIQQYPGYVLFVFDNGTRIIHLDEKKPHLPDNIKLWNGDSRGHWEGNTLVVDVANHNGKALFGRSGEFISENGHIQERYIFSQDGKRYNYVAVLTDPTVYTRPFTVTIPARKWTDADESDGWNLEARWAKTSSKERILEHDERICYENNGGFGLGASGASAKK
ncbi:uncharacterized protein NMK_1332 [Novimethylophilus kurashikiensis]|uniref:Uncharacterized protein n=2 Tax=Novimethylophilus kurashikiensis TaxID=1825523 RepID=A0A2R5FAR8_9PROT|nr:uncharacterized protein NMK_1332 [Novimethylophilus kurashikiensis]